MKIFGRVYDLSVMCNEELGTFGGWTIILTYAIIAIFFNYNCHIMVSGLDKWSHALCIRLLVAKNGKNAKVPGVSERKL